MNEKASSLFTPHSSLDTLHSSLLTSRRLLVTGGCGFIGLNLIKFLIHKGYQNIRILDNLSSGTKESVESLLSELGTFSKKETKNLVTYSLALNSTNPKNSFSPRSSALDPNDDSSLLTSNSSLGSKVELVIGDIRDKQTCSKATEGIDAVVHLAAHAGVIPSVDDPFFDFETNALGTLNLLHGAMNSKVDRFVFASSNAPVGNQAPPLSEGKAPKPLSPYGASKLSCEGYCSAFYGSYGLRTVILRFSNVYGSYCLHKESVIAKFIKDGILNGSLTIYGDGEQSRDFIHVDDLCQAIHLILNKPLAPHSSPLAPGSVCGETFHLGIKISFAPERKGEIKRNYSDITKAKEILGFCPQISLKDGVESVYKWFMNKDTDEIKKAAVLSGSE